MRALNLTGKPVNLEDMESYEYEDIILDGPNLTPWEIFNINLDICNRAKDMGCEYILVGGSFPHLLVSSLLEEAELSGIEICYEYILDTGDTVYIS